MTELVVERLAKSYPAPGEPLVVLREVDLAMSRGESLAIVGPSGSGKSTLLHILGTLESPTAGSVRLLGEDPFALDEPRLATFRNRHLGFIFQEHHLLPQLNVLENVLVAAMAQGRPSPEQVVRAKTLLDRVGLGHRLTHRPAELSGGERQRVAVARALLNQPALVLADEPTGSLDRTNAAAIGELLASLARDEKAVLVVVTHSADLAAKLGRRMEIDDGKLVESKG